MPEVSVRNTKITSISYTTKIEYDANNNPIYIGDAIPSSLTTAAVWRIKKLTYDINNGQMVTQISTIYMTTGQHTHIHKINRW